MKMIQWTCLALVTAGFVLLAGCGKSHDHDHDHDHAGHDHGATAAKPYPLDVCIVSGEKLGSMGEPVVRVHEGQEVKFCCKDCVGEFERKPAEFLAKLNR